MEPLHLTPSPFFSKWRDFRVAGLLDWGGSWVACGPSLTGRICNASTLSQTPTWKHGVSTTGRSRRLPGTPEPPLCQQGNPLRGSATQVALSSGAMGPGGLGAARPFHRKGNLGHVLPRTGIITNVTAHLIGTLPSRGLIKHWVSPANATDFSDNPQAAGDPPTENAGAQSASIPAGVGLTGNYDPGPVLGATEAGGILQLTNNLNKR